MPFGSRGCVSFWISAFVSHTSVSRHVAGRWGRAAVDDREIDPLGLAARELRLQPPLGLGILGEDDQTGGVLVDAMNDEADGACRASESRSSICS